MNKMLAIGLAALLAVLLSGRALAQTDTPAASPAENPEPSAYLTLDMKAGFVLDPFLVSLNGGGEVDASTLDPACVGFINDKPVMVANWEGEVDFLDIFFYSDTDPTLVIQLPDGTYQCADDANDNLLDPELTIENPAAGQYKIWVGSYDAGHLIPGLLVITANGDYSLSNFAPGKLIQRPSIPQEDVQPVVSEESIAANATISTTAKLAPHGTIMSDSEPLTATVTTTGTVPAFLLTDSDTLCSGMVEDFPDYILQVSGELDNLRVAFEGDSDATLVVIHKDGGPWCVDDAEATVNANPLVDIAAPAEGLYGIFVGRFDPETPLTGTLTISAGTDVAPVILEPVAPPEP
jgi:hypothetical protein